VARDSLRVSVCLASLCLALAACANGGAEKVASKIFAADQTLVFDRSSDLLPPESLRVTSNADRQISLAWEPVLVGDVAGYAILRGTGSNGEGTFHKVGITTSRFGTVFTDAGEKPGSLGDGQTYSYRVHPYDRQGRVSRSHAALTATTEPKPSIPESLQVYSNLPRKAVLSWKPSEQRAVSGYGVYRCPTMAGPWEKVTFVEGRLNSVYEDSIPGDLRVMYYRITALNRFGGESEMTESAIRAVTKAEPLPPTGLQADAHRLGRVALKWAHNVEPDVTGYEVWRSDKLADDFGAEQRIATVEAAKTEYLDAAVGCGETVRYRLRALDADGLESFYSEPLEVTGPDLALSLTRSEGGLVLHWDAARVKRFASARVSERRSVLPDRELANVSGVAEVALPELAPGTQLEVALAGPADGGSDPPRCRISVPSGS
jgi:fibronectin type 3 domain-containing protein